MWVIGYRVVGEGSGVQCSGVGVECFGVSVSSVVFGLQLPDKRHSKTYGGGGR